MAENPGADGSMTIEIPADIYVGRNVVRKHLVEFYYRAATQNLLSEGEQVLAVIDCVVLEPNGGRLGGLTLHDYAIMTNLHLITWGRGRTRDTVDKFVWADVALEKFGRRTLLEGVVKFTYRTKPVGNKRKISIRSKENGNGNGHDHDDNISDVVGNVPGGGVVLYLDLIPLEDVKSTVEFMRFLIAGGNVDGFYETFRSKIDESTQRLTSVNELMKPFYVQQSNGVFIEDGDMEEDILYRTVSGSGENRRSVPSLKQGVASPYRLGGTGATTRATSTTRSTTTPRPVASAPAPREDSDGGLAPLAKGGYTGPRGSNSRQGSSTTSPSGSGPRAKENSLGGTVSLNTAPYSGPSKLDGETRSSSVSRSSSVAVSAPRPAPRPVAAERVVPPSRPTAPVSTGSGAVMDERQVSSRGDRPLVMPIGVVIGKEALNIYSISRLARGLWLDPRNLGRNIGDIGATTALLTDLLQVVATDEETRRVALNRLRKSLSAGTLNNNIVLHYTVWPFLKPILDLLTSANQEQPTVRNRVKVRATEPPTTEPTPPPPPPPSDLPSMGAEVAKDIAAAAEISIVPAEDSHLNTSGKISIDPTANLGKDDAPPPPSKLDKL